MSAATLSVVVVVLILQVAAEPPGPASWWQPVEELWDDFQGDNLNTSKWLNYNPQWLGRQPGLFRPENVIVTNGQLELWARPYNVTDPKLQQQGYGNYSTSAVQSTTTYLYGYIEARSRPGSSSVSSAFWLNNSQNQTWTEIDINELCGETAAPTYSLEYFMHTHIFELDGVPAPQLMKQCACLVSGGEPRSGFWRPHRLSPAAPNQPVTDDSSCTQGKNLHSSNPWADDFHIYGLEWNATTVSYYLDGAMVWQLPNSCLHQPLIVRFDRETMPDWFGLPAVSSLPDRPMTVDYVHTWRRVDSDIQKIL